MGTTYYAVNHEKKVVYDCDKVITFYSDKMDDRFHWNGTALPIQFESADAFHAWLLKDKEGKNWSSEELRKVAQDIYEMGYDALLTDNTIFDNDDYAEYVVVGAVYPGRGSEIGKTLRENGYF